MFKRSLSLLAVSFALAFAASAADYPNKPIKLVIGYAAGGGTDLLGRIIAEEMAARLGQQVVVENKPGASGAIAASDVASANPDGYTLWLATQGPLTVVPLIQQPKPYDPISEFEHVTTLGTTCLALVVAKDFPASDFQAFVEEVKANPGKYTYATAGIGGPGHVSALLLMREVDLKMRHIPYTGDSKAMVDLLSGVVPIWFAGCGTVGTNANTQNYQILAVSQSARKKQLPEVPTIAESGYPEYEFLSFNALLAPAGTPTEVIELLQSTVVDIYKDEKVREKIEQLGYDPKTMTPDETRAFIVSDIEATRSVVDQISAEQQ